MLSYGWPLSADDWDTQMLFFLGESRVAKAVLISAVPPLIVQTEANPGGLRDRPDIRRLGMGFGYLPGHRLPVPE